MEELSRSVMKTYHLQKQIKPYISPNVENWIHVISSDCLSALKIVCPIGYRIVEYNCNDTEVVVFLP
ncbi:hypothetical protein A8709_18010 [Paenibacillus pectinilyticus]|uniref:Uncharacterized protein n=1 Tax=Paenibacillus pectinilyticus TaxID=512399 RepID=A0A1C0ZZC3_9BACL|nr:hypothetical protein A8709_18010 [Paenibacillus pectinilyticus]